MIGFDIETTGLDPKKSGIISMGFYMPHVSLYLVNNPLPCYVDKDALDVNGFTVEQIESFERLDDKAVALNLASLVHGIHFKDFKDIPETNLLPVGLNVGAFDMVFLKQHFPLTASLFHYRCIDLTGIAHFVSELFEVEKEEVKEASKKTISAWFSDPNMVQGNSTVIQMREHNAFYDAMLAYEMYGEFRNQTLKAIGNKIANDLDMIFLPF